MFFCISSCCSIANSVSALIKIGSLWLHVAKKKNTFLTSNDYEFVNFLSEIASNAEAKFANREHADHNNVKNFYFAHVTKTNHFGKT